MTPAQIHRQFEQLLRRGSIGCRQRRQLGMSASQACWYRYAIAHQRPPSHKTMLRWLQKAGIDVGNARAYSPADMQLFAQYCTRYTNREARKLGFAYLLDKWEAQQQTK